MDDIRGRFRRFDQPSSAGYRTIPEKPKFRTYDEEDEPLPILTERPEVRRQKTKKIRSKSKKSGAKKFWIFTLIFLILAGGVGTAYIWKKKIWFFKPKNIVNNSPSVTAPTDSSLNVEGNKNKSSRYSLRFVATGDFTPYLAILKQADKGGGSYNFDAMLAGLGPYFKASDIRFCNQDTPSGGAELSISGYPSFNAPKEWSAGLASAGCNLIGLASNNINDKGQAGIDATLAAWSAQKTLAIAGANSTAEEQAKVKVFEIEGIKFAFLAYTTTSNNQTLTPHGVNIYNQALAQKQISEARKTVDIVIVSMHWGFEDADTVNEEQLKVGQQLADFGADVILGHGPHRLQPVEIIDGLEDRKTLIWYSLGSSLNAQLPIESLIGGLAVMDIDINSKKITAIAFLPIYVHYEWTAQQKASHDLLARRNFGLFSLDEASDELARSQNSTSVEAQTARVKAIMNTNLTVNIFTSMQFLDSSPIR